MDFKDFIAETTARDVIQILVDWYDPIIEAREPEWKTHVLPQLLDSPKLKQWLDDLGIEGQIGDSLGGVAGIAFPIGNDYILKVTADRKEAQAAAVLAKNPSPHAAKILGVKFISKFTPAVGIDQFIYAIVMERLNTDVSRKFRIAGGAIYDYMDQHPGAIKDLDQAYQEILAKLNPKYRQDKAVQYALQKLLHAVTNLHQNTGVLTQDTHGANLAFKNRTPAFFDFGRSTIDFDNPRTAGVRLDRL